MAHAPTIRRTLRHPQFRALWASGTAYFVGNAMQSMAASWMMVELSGSAFLAALVQTAVFLPMFLLSLPAGVLADTTDRARLILGALMVQLVVGTLLAVLTITKVGGAGTVLFFIFLSGCCTALLSPAWNSAVADSVPRHDLPQAITAVGIAYNAARAVGPALAGLVYTHVGGAWNFVLAVLGTAIQAHAIWRRPPKPHPPSRLPPERLWGGMASALRFAWHSHTVFSQLLRAAAYSAAGSALWALLPTIGQKQLGLGAAGFGLMMGCLGSGAIVAGLFIGRLRVRFGLEALVAGGCVVFAVAMLVSAFSAWDPPVYAALVLAGGAWMAVMSTFNTATQTSVPPWVRSRAVAMHTLSALGAFAFGSAFWGALSDLAGLSVALGLATVCMAIGPLMARRYPLRMGEAEEVTPATPWEDLFLPHEPDPEAGPVAVEIGYRILPANAEDFLDAIGRMRAPRRRDGASLWRVYRDLADPSRYVERFIVRSWAEYLHQRSRATQADRAIEAHVRSFLIDGEKVSVHRYIAER